jgi:hypothetical protein
MSLEHLDNDGIDKRILQRSSSQADRSLLAPSALGLSVFASIRGWWMPPGHNLKLT